MELPEGIEEEILEYLHIEYGEDPRDPTSLKLDQIVYDGVYEINGVPTHYFQYSSASGRNWVTLEPYGDSYVIGMTSSTPKPISKNDLYHALRISNIDGDFSETIELESRGEGNFGLSNYQDIALPDGTKLEILAEVTSYSAPTGVTISIKEAKNKVYIHGSVGLSLSYQTKTCTTLFLTLGTGPWE